MNRKIVIGIIVALTAAASVLIYLKLNPKELPPYLVQAIGKVDGDLINVNTKYPGRVVKINVDMGDKVKKGEVIAVLDSKEYQDKLKAIENQIKAKENELNFTTVKINDTIKKTKKGVAAKQKELNALTAQIESLKLVIVQDKKDEKRIKNLVTKKQVEPHQFEMARLKTRTDLKKLKALNAKKEALLIAIKIAKDDLHTAIAAKENIKALKNAINALKAQRDEIQTVINKLTIKSPINGYVDTKIAQKGEVLGVGMPVASLINPKELYVVVFVDEITNGKIKLGDKAEIFLDSFSNDPIPAVVSRIAKKAEFTPKEVAVKSDRVTRVYEVRLKPTEPNPYLKLGLPATGVILIGNGSLPKSLDEIPEL